jgi:hypothetical protein
VKQAVFVAGPLLVAAALALLWGAQVALASHPIQPPYLWFDLQPGDDRHLNYDLCSDGDPNEAYWQQEVENWDATIAGWEFDPAACGSYPTQITGADLITRSSDGTLRLHEGNCIGGFKAGTGGVIGTGGNAFNWLF